jgi:hypothetical protein
MRRYDPHQAPDPKEWNALDEQERMQLVEQYHRRAGIRLPNAKVHAVIHAVVENQIVLGDELPVRRTLQRLMSEGLDRHDAIHAIGSVLAEHMFELLSTPEAASKPDPNDAYCAAVERLTAEDRPDGSTSRGLPQPQLRMSRGSAETTDFGLLLRIRRTLSRRDQAADRSRLSPSPSAARF